MEEEVKTVRCKMTCEKMALNDDGSANIRLNAVYDGSPENKEFFKYTPSGQLSINSVNQTANALFVTGKEYYIDITLAE